MFSDKKNKGRVPFRPAPERNLGHDPSGAGQAPRFLRAWWRVTTILLLLTGTLNAAFASSYVYDANGRLTAATAPGGGTVQYTYDSLGNILSVQPVTSGQLAVFSFSPQQGPVGSQVTIDGNGFSTTTSSDTVTFNGVSTTVVSATATQIVATVPTGATSGPIAITVRTANVTSSEDFVVVQAPPTLTGFTPDVGDVGTSVTISGTGLDPVSGATTVTFGGVPATITSASNTQLVINVPPGAISGPIQVTTQGGQVSSVTDFIVAPSTIGAANIASSAMMTPDGPAQTLTVDTANDSGVLVFNATIGQWLSLQLTALTTTGNSGSNTTYAVYSPGNVQIASGSVAAGITMSIHLPVITASGAYLVIFGSGSGTVQLSAILETDATVAINGPTVSSATNVSAQSKRLIFTAHAAQNLGFGFTNLTLSPTTSPGIGPYASISVDSPGGSPILNRAMCLLSNVGCGFDFGSLPQTGTYSIVVQPDAAETMSFNATLSTPVIGTLSPNTAFTLNLTRPGQDGLLSFTATTGQTLALMVSNLSTTPANQYLTITIDKPDGTVLTSIDTSDHTFNLPDLSAGTYTVSIVPDYAATATLQVTVVPGVTGTLTTTGGTSSFNTATPGQNVYLSFSATKGQNLKFGINDLTVSPSGVYPYMTVSNPDGSSLMSAFCFASNGGCGLNLANLPQTGAYQVMIQPDYTQTMSFSVGLAVAGDLNDDGVVNNADALLAERIALGLITPTPFQQAAGDVAPLVNGVPSPDGVINFQDVLLIQRKALGLVQY